MQKIPLKVKCEEFRNKKDADLFNSLEHQCGDFHDHLVGLYHFSRSVEIWGILVRNRGILEKTPDADCHRGAGEHDSRISGV